MDRDPRTRDCVLLLGAEGCSEVEGKPWLRDPTEEERAAHRAECDRDDYDDLFVDHNGRPYWLKVVTREAPLVVWLCASSHLKLLRLET